MTLPTTRPPAGVVDPEAASLTPAPKAPMSVGRQTAYYALGNVLGRSIGFVMLPFYTRLLTPAEYGVIQLVTMTFELVAMVAGSRIAAGVFRFYHKAATTADKHRVLSTALILIVSGYVLAAVGAMLLAEQLSQLVFDTPQWAGLLRLAALSFIMQGLVLVPNISLRAFGKPLVFISRGVSQQALTAGLNITFLTLFGMGVYSAFLSSAIAFTLYGVVMAVVLLRHTGVGFSLPVAKDLWRFGLPLIATQMAMFLMTLGGRFLLQRDAGPTQVGLYALAGTFAGIMIQFGHSPFMLVWESERFRVAERPDRDAIYARSFVMLNAMLLTVAVLVGVLVRDFLRVMADAAYGPAVWLVPIVLGSSLLQSWSMAQDVGIMVTENTRYLAIANWIAAAVAVLGFWILIPRIGAFGAAGGTLLAFATRYALIYSLSQRCWPVRYRWPPVLRLLAYASATIAIAFARPTVELPLSLVIDAALCAAFGITAWFGGVFTPDERAMVSGVVRSRVGAARALFPMRASRSAS